MKLIFVCQLKGPCYLGEVVVRNIHLYFLHLLYNNSIVAALTKQNAGLVSHPSTACKPQYIQLDVKTCSEIYNSSFRHVFYSHDTTGFKIEAYSRLRRGCRALTKCPCTDSNHFHRTTLSEHCCGSKSTLQLIRVINRDLKG